MVTAHWRTALRPHLRVDARALARRSDRIDAEVVVVANLRHILRLEHAPVASLKLGVAVLR